MFDVLKRTKFLPIHLAPGDSLKLTWNDPAGGETVLCEHTLDAETAMTVTEGLLVRAVVEGRRALGGFVLEEVKEVT